MNLSHPSPQPSQTYVSDDKRVPAGLKHHAPALNHLSTAAGVKAASAHRGLVWVLLATEGDWEADFAQICTAQPHAFVIAMAKIPQAAQALQCLSKGAKAYVNVQASSSTIAQIEQAVLAGGVWLGADLVALLSTAIALRPNASDEGSTPAVGTGWKATLTTREQEVALAVGRGESNKQIARVLGITERTVKAHLTAIFQKLEITDRLRLALLITGQA